MSDKYPTFELWLAELKQLAKERDWLYWSAASDCEWRGYYDDDYTPLEALQEDASYV